MTRLICLIGPDGTGKTTQAKRLIQKLNEIGIDCIYRWMRFHHFFSLPILAIARIIGLSKIEKTKSGLKIGYHYFYKSKIISKLYIVTMYLDTLVSYFLNIWLPIQIFRKTVICDRFVHDTLIDIMISTKNYELLDSKIGKKFLSLVPKNAIVIMLLADANTLRQRREDILIDKTLLKRLELYQKLAEKVNIQTIDSSRSIEEVHQNIITKIQRYSREGTINGYYGDI